jgi:hypothetical protein
MGRSAAKELRPVPGSVRGSRAAVAFEALYAEEQGGPPAAPAVAASS